MLEKLSFFYATDQTTHEMFHNEIENGLHCSLGIYDENILNLGFSNKKRKGWKTYS